MSSQMPPQTGASPSRSGQTTGAPPNMPEKPQTRETAQGTTGLRRAALAAGTRIFNPLIRRLAGSRAFPLFAIVRHRGRRSARLYATPVAARPTADGFVIPLTFGERADWFRNTLAAGGCVIRWKGAEYEVVDPRIVDWTTARPELTRAERVLMPLIGIKHVVRLRRAPAGGPAQ